MEKQPPASESRSGHPETGQRRRLCEFEWVRTDAETGRAVARFDHESVPLGIAVPALVAERAGVDPVSLPPMYDCIDVDALEAVAAERPESDRRVTVTFQYTDYIIGVDGGRLDVTPVESDSSHG